MRFSPAYRPAVARMSPRPAEETPQQQQHAATVAAPAAAPVAVYERMAPPGTAPYPKPGSVADCAACGSLVSRYYHCVECAADIPFDLCVACCASIYLNKGGDPNALNKIKHPKHSISSHTMVRTPR